MKSGSASGIDLEVLCHFPFYAVEIGDESAEARRQLRESARKKTTFVAGSHSDYDSAPP